MTFPPNIFPSRDHQHGLNRPRYFAAIAAVLALLFPLAAHAEESLASLLWILPAAMAMELYFNLLAIYPWLFGAMVISFFWRTFTGRDLIPFLFDTDTRDGIFGGRTWGFNLHRTLAVATGFSTMVLVLGVMLINPKFLSNPDLLRGKPAAAAVQPPPPPPAPPVPPLHPAPNGVWPSVADYLVPHIDREKGLARFRVYNTEKLVAAYVKLCRAFEEQCILQRQFYLPPQTSLLVDNLVDGNYRLVFLENHPPNFATGQSAIIRVHAGRAHAFDWTLPAVVPTDPPGKEFGFGAATRAAFDAVK